MWDTTDLDRYMPRAHRESDGKSSGIPHLAKNERDVGHPSLVKEPGALVIVPVFDQAGKRVIGTIDVESEEPHAFTQEIEDLLETCSKAIRPIWDYPH
jgi:GAF domain-containing protein